MSHRALSALLIAASAFTAASCTTARESAPAAPASPTLPEFDRKIHDYLKLRNDAGAGVAPLPKTESGGEIASRQKQLAARIQQARPNAKPGDIFTPEIAAEFRRLLARNVQGQKKERVQESLERSEPVRFDPRVNSEYPEQVPLQSVPPTVLASLPKLPQELRYGIVDHDLLLQDAGANLIVDFIPGAIP